MNWNNVTQSEEVIVLIKQREAINDKIKLIDENALINYELEALNITPVINSLPTREALEDKNELCNSWGNTSHPDECYGQGLEDMYDAIKYELF